MSCEAYPCFGHQSLGRVEYQDHVNAAVENLRKHGDKNVCFTEEGRTVVVGDIKR